MKIRKNENGFTLIEALVAMVILTIGIMTMYTMQISSIQGNSTASQITTAATAGADQIENIFAMDYDLLIDLTADGTGGLQDAQCCFNGNDPAGIAVTGCTARADGCAPGPEGYAIYWNVAVDEPMPATKRVVVSVARTDSGVRKNVVYEYMKAQIVQL
jgi:prepilin-type N-terminal cleavage/methylation domain-containing protein